MGVRPAKGLLKEHASTFNAIMHLVDWFIIALTGWLAHWFYLGSPSLEDHYEAALLIGVLLTSLVFSRFNVYRV